MVFVQWLLSLTDAVPPPSSNLHGLYNDQNVVKSLNASSYAYAGWNTAGNALGTAVANGILLGLLFGLLGLFGLALYYSAMKWVFIMSYPQVMTVYDPAISRGGRERGQCRIPTVAHPGRRSLSGLIGLSGLLELCCLNNSSSNSCRRTCDNS